MTADLYMCTVTFKLMLPEVWKFSQGLWYSKTYAEEPWELLDFDEIVPPPLRGKTFSSLEELVEEFGNEYPTLIEFI